MKHTVPCHKTPAAIVAWLLWAAFAVALSCHATATAQAAAITRHTLAAGTRWATPYYVQNTHREGPTVVILGGVHGNEPAGAWAADQIRHWPITRGKIIVLPRANQPGLRAATRCIPDVEPALRDLNRDFPKNKKDSAPAGELATKIWTWLRGCRPDWVIDLHEGTGFHQLNRKTVGSSIIAYGKVEEAVPLMLEAVNATITDPKKRLVPLRGSLKGTLAWAAGSILDAHSMICETTSSSQPLSLRTRQHRIMVHRLLTHLEMLPPEVTPGWLTDHRRRPAELAVALYDAEGTGGKGVPALTRLLSHKPHVWLVHVGPTELTDPVLAQFDLIVFPGGSGSAQAKAIGEKGRQAVVQFVQRGGSYLGICAGAYLATSKFSWGLKILDAQTVSPKWNRGQGTVKVEMSPEGSRMLRWKKKDMDVLYHNGPILMGAGLEALPDYQTLATFRSEVAKHGSPPGIMINSPAIVAARFGKGRVLCTSPHFDNGPHEAILWHAIQWLTKRNQPRS
ncbi:MAG: succinylglutamate desuccinylase/aspartoacylase family protein [Pirellulales bacterium]|nr:succinylglutamate desuccinylase/aspartoacylase family protein [Pirellulales bacterium]